MHRIILAAQQYKHLKFYNNFATLRMLLWGIYGGFLLGLALSYYNKVFIGGFIRTLLKKEALSAESAVSLSSLDIKKKGIIKWALKHDSALKKYIGYANEEDITTCVPTKGFKRFVRKMYGKDENIVKKDLDRADIYIFEELKYRADVLFDKKGSRPSSFIIFAIILTVLVIGVSIAIPELLTMLDNFLEMILPKE